MKLKQTHYLGVYVQFVQHCVSFVFDSNGPGEGGGSTCTRLRLSPFLTTTQDLHTATPHI